MSFELDVKPTGFNVSIQTMISESYSKAMTYNSSIHRVIVDANKKNIFSPQRLKASVGDTILFTSVEIQNRIAQVCQDQRCQADDSLSLLNFSRLTFSYLVTTEKST